MFGDRTDEAGGFGLSYPQAGLGLFAFVPEIGDRVTVAWSGDPKFDDLVSLCRKAALALHQEPFSIRLIAFDEEGPKSLIPTEQSGQRFVRLQVGVDIDHPDIVVWGDSNIGPDSGPNIGVEVNIGVLDKVTSLIQAAASKALQIPALSEPLSDLAESLASIPNDIKESRSAGLGRGTFA